MNPDQYQVHMQRSKYAAYFQGGLVFLREHPQLWSTALVGVLICAAFIFTAYRFASVAQDAQQQLMNDRAGWMLDGIVVFAPEIVTQPNVLSDRLAALVAENETVEDLVVLVRQKAGTWSVLASGTHRWGEVRQVDQFMDTLYRTALSDPASPYSTVLGAGDERRFVTARAIVDASGVVHSLAVSEQRLSQADKLLADTMRTSFYILGGVLGAILLLFFRHARIIDYAALYKKQLEVDEMKDSFISMASHELKSPLTVIRGYIEFLREGSLDDTERTEYLRRIDLSADELRGLIDDILDVSRIEMGRMRFSPDQVRVADVCAEVAEMFSVQATAKGLTLVFEPTPEALGAFAYVDRGRLKQVLVNLVSNAVKYSLAGSVRVTEYIEHGHLTIAVRDTGVGMTAEEQQKLFTKFYRVEAAETKGTTGTGLGLWITKYIIEHMGGVIAAESIKGAGSRFVVSFPLQRREA